MIIGDNVSVLVPDKSRARPDGNLHDIRRKDVLFFGKGVYEDDAGSVLFKDLDAAVFGFFQDGQIGGECWFGSCE